MSGPHGAGVTGESPNMVLLVTENRTQVMYFPTSQRFVCLFLHAIRYHYQQSPHFATQYQILSLHNCNLGAFSQLSPASLNLNETYQLRHIKTAK